MSVITKTKRRKVFFEVLTPFLESKGYQAHLKGDDPSFSLKKDKLVVSFGFNFISNGEIVCGPLNISHYDVEDYLLSTGMPSNTLELHKQKDKYHLATVQYRKGTDGIKGRPLDSEEDVVSFANSYMDYIKNEGAAFIEKYSALPEVLKEMNRLESLGSDWNEILGGMGDRLIRGVIISKLCNDSVYEDKLKYCEDKFSNVDLLKEWIPYWEKYKQLLLDISPKYNLT